MRLIGQLRNEGRTVLVHCVAAPSRTPTVAARYGAHRQGISGGAALQEGDLGAPTRAAIPPSPKETGTIIVFMTRDLS